MAVCCIDSVFSNFDQDLFITVHSDGLVRRKINKNVVSNCQANTIEVAYLHVHHHLI